MSTKIQVVKAMAFPVVMYGCESWTRKKAEHQGTDAFELWCWKRLLKSPLDCKRIKPVHSKGNQSWIFIGRTDAKAPTFWPPDAKSQLSGKDIKAEKDWEQEEEGTTEDKIVSITDSMDMSPWGHKELDMTEQLNTHTHTQGHLQSDLSHYTSPLIPSNAHHAANLTILQSPPNLSATTSPPLNPSHLFKLYLWISSNATISIKPFLITPIKISPLTKVSHALFPHSPPFFIIKQ